jgi:hypothetical protein
MRWTKGTRIKRDGNVGMDRKNSGWTREVHKEDKGDRRTTEELDHYRL